MAKAARERLALALNALQGDPNTPQALLDLADPIAESMGILHRIERSQGSDLAGRDVALTNVRGTLNSLQVMTFNHPALDEVMDHVAGCLASVHQLARYQPPAPPAPAPTPVQPAPAPPAAHAVHDGAVTMAAPANYAAAAAAAAAPAPAPPAGSPAASPHGTNPMALGGTQVMQPSPVAAFQNAFPAQAANAPTMPIPQPVVPVAPAAAAPNQTLRIEPGQAHVPHAAPQAAPPAAPAHFPPAPAQPAAAFSAPAPAAGFAAPAAQPAPASKGAASSQSGNVVVELGTHSVSNFYKGLGGNDVIEHGGIFVATYKIPKIGAQVNLRILLPGDYEFQAAGVVQWIREPHSAGESSEPGFGARFVQITPEGRQLVYRYTRNREPMFYDDL